MALLNNENKYIFFHFFKCGGNSIRLALNPNPETSCEFEEGHSIPRDIKQIMYDSEKKDIYDNYFKFAFIRNPFDWIVSTYYYIKIFENHGNHNDVSKLNLNEFISYYVNYMMPNQGFNLKLGVNKCVTPMEYITDNGGNLIVDFVGRFENLNEDYKEICDKIGIEYKEPPIYNVNMSKEKDYRKYYDNNSRKLVEKLFAKDLEYFKYSF
ncbi:MAG: sulfotransferase family 2 domain-containing protein [Micavibrio sp.]|nr:sulfotransferase family 2 domain-containing protein [Micavibrio sp.]